ncbi:hypothetical protein AVEN_269754-1 [Araneus ventricosus]|uniref:Uncharacterized protein n=1 Tax=Araneus ventricosus TaxID=182803 RepID=A0A4Y2EF76_ARAVE|nr:hypothetical protein AVEN_269754-1 [Araneus ventricosus]
MIAKAKQDSFRNFLASVVKNNTIDSFYRIVKNNLAVSGELHQIEKQTGELTRTFKETLSLILEYHFPKVDTDILMRQQNLNYNLNWTFPLVTKSEIGQVVQDFSPDKVQGPDRLTLGIIKEIYNLIMSGLFLFSILLLRRAVFLDVWKQAKVILIPKEVKTLSDPSAYRPICLLSIWGKILDEIISQRLIYELETNSKLSNNQFGFRRGHSTIMALEQILNYIQTSKLAKKITIAIRSL